MEKERIINMLKDIEKSLLISIEAGNSKINLYKDSIEKNIKQKQIK